MQLGRKDTCLNESMVQGNVKVTYTDDQGDEIAVSDDEDLYAAYDWATSSSAGNLKFKVASTQPVQEDLAFKKLLEAEDSDFAMSEGLNGSDSEPEAPQSKLTARPSQKKEKVSTDKKKKVKKDINAEKKPVEKKKKEKVEEMSKKSDSKQKLTEEEKTMRRIIKQAIKMQTEHLVRENLLEPKK